MNDTATRQPGAKWMLIGAAAFAAGFFGPLMFDPEANQGPLVGILITGPLGLMLSLLLWAVSAIFKVPAGIQWRVLYTVAAVGVLITLFCVQPEPKVRGYVFEGEVESCATPTEAEAEVLDYWEGRIADVSWKEPRAGWRADMQRLLGDAPGVVVSVRMQRENTIKENRKPWNSGTRFAAGWSTKSDETPFYDASGSCDRYPDGTKIRGYQESDYEERIRSADIWPPTELLYVLSASVLAPVPEQWAAL